MKTKAQELGEAIEKDRTRTGASQEDVAKAVGVTQQALSGWEVGASLPRSARLERLRDIFGPESETAMVVDHIMPRGSKLIFTRQEYDDEMHNRGIPATVVSITHPSKDHNDHAQSTAGEHISRSKINMRKLRGMGTMNSEPKETPPPTSSDEPTAHVEQVPPAYGIKSFESPHKISHHGLGQADEIHDALTRAASGVQLARQVLDDAASQIARAISKLKA